jgi:TolA-binding protein
MKVGECRNELSVLARRGRLSPGEQTKLTAHLDACDDCRLAFRAGAAFDSAATLEPDDGMRIARLGIAARRWAELPSASPLPARGREKNARVLLIAACWFLVAAIGTAAAHVLTRTPEAPRRADPPPEPGVLTARPLRGTPAAGRREESVPEVPVAPSAQVAPDAEGKSQLAPRRAPSAESAKVLFQRASRARRAGDNVLARGLYQRLQREFPASSEASLSTLRLGSLLLEQGNAAGALAQFDRYLAASAGGGLTPEALNGRGRALAALGRSSEEQRTWARLLKEFPACPYVAHARRRLDASAVGTEGTR